MGDDEIRGSRIRRAAKITGTAVGFRQRTRSFDAEPYEVETAEKAA